MPTICAWCADERGTAEAIGPRVASHGLCAPCLDARLAELSAAVPVPPADATEQEAA